MTNKNKKVLKAVGYVLILGYVVGMLFLVSYLKKQAMARQLDFAIANSVFDIYAITLGMALITFMPFKIGVANKRITLLSFAVFVILLSMAVYIKYYTYSGEVIADLLYVFCGAVFLQGVKYAVKWAKEGSTGVEIEENKTE